MGTAREQIALQQDSFHQGDLDDLERTLRRWIGKVSGVVGATSLTESTRLGKLAQQLNLLCFVSNNNPAVWQHRSHIFHIGVPIAMTSAAVAQRLLHDLKVKRVYILHDRTEFQKQVARTTESSLKRGGAEVYSSPGSQIDWHDSVLSWKPDVVYLAYSEEHLAVRMTEGLRRALPNVPLLVGRILLRRTFFVSLGDAAEGLFLVDIFHRGVPQTYEEAMFTRVLSQAGVELPTANHGFGWDAMTLCGLALAKAEGEPSSAIRYLESGVDFEGASGNYRFSAEDHIGRRVFNPTSSRIA